MSKQVSPEWFARRQRFSLAIPALVTISLAVLGWFAFDHGTSHGVWRVTLSIGGYIFGVLALGGIAWGYLAWYLSLRSKGILDTPHHAWRVSVESDTLSIVTSKRSTQIPFAVIKGATILWDDNWDKLKGLEDKCLAVDIQGGARILVPGSSLGFDEALSQIRQRLNIETKFVE